MTAEEDLTPALKACVLGRLVLRGLIFRGHFWWSIQIYPKAEKTLGYHTECGYGTRTVLWRPVYHKKLFIIKHVAQSVIWYKDSSVETLYISLCKAKKDGTPLTFSTRKSNDPQNKPM
ncbi:hypothetical protein QJS04_geneDACA016098 [Acorus gramineus]|uniref:Uncharacterized protein n=1 Tax=Acorus gramineus TaxID=55184 RepID=A0AAV9BIK3_ACOGR|nr:hypothetical protein QJS04_geneDACA016098 [Acorus gramineus]